MDNKSSREIKEMTVSLMQNIKFHATRKTRDTFRTVASVSYPKNVPEKTVENWNVGIGIDNKKLNHQTLSLIYKYKLLYSK
jgi:hypothetical protein